MSRFAALIRVFGIIRKELTSVVRQPRLILTLILGPFLIVLVFGLGYRSQPAPYRTLVVLGSDDAGLAADPERLRDVFGGSIDLVGVITDPAVARGQLRDGEIDLVIVAPPDPLATLEEGKQASFTLVHAETDPTIRSNIAMLARISIDQVNRLVLEEVVSTAQEGSEQVEGPLAALRGSAGDLRAALESGDSAAADMARGELEEQVAGLRNGTLPSSALYAGVAALLGADGRQGLDRLDDLLERESPGDPSSEAQELEEAITALETDLDRARALDPGLLVSPFGVEVEQVAAAEPSPSIFYVPGTLVLLVQHIAVTFAALSLVRERQLGLTELFRVSPLTVTQALVGKYVAFVIMTGLVASILTGTMFAFGVPMPESVLAYVTVLTLVILASLGLGFVISALARNDSQAVQYSMMILLVSIFFTGFVLPLEQLTAPVQIISYLLPATYGVSAVRGLLFRGGGIEPLLLVGLVGFTLALGVASWWAMRREVAGAR
jgi:ABC-2 type transport system permease protein